MLSVPMVVKPTRCPTSLMAITATRVSSVISMLRRWSALHGPMTDLNGNVIEEALLVHIGFPGFDGMSASVSLGYVAAMQEHGVPVTYAYISDAHDAHPSGPAYGPGQAGYVSALAVI